MAKSKVVDLQEVIPAPALRRFRVCLPPTPPMVVEAADGRAAWDHYRKANGILATDHRPTVEEVE